LRKLAILDAARSLNDSVQNHQATRLSARSGETAMASTASASTDQFRLCFQLTEAGPEDVEIVDYHLDRRCSFHPGEVLLVEEFCGHLGISSTGCAGDRCAREPHQTPS